MNKIKDVQANITKASNLDGLDMGLHTSQGLMALSALKQYMNIQGLQMPSMNYTHYVRFARHPQMVLEWLLRCNFLPLFYTGNTTDAEEACNAQFFLDNLADDIEGVLERYPITNHDFDGYKALIPADRITPHMILDFRGLGAEAARIGHDVVNAYINEVCDYVKEVQDTMDTYGDKWDIEKNHNPLITVLTDDCYNGYVWVNKDVQSVHRFECFEKASALSWQYGTKAKTYVRVYTKQES